MNLLIFSRDYFCNMFKGRCMDEKQIIKLQRLGVSIYLIVQNHPSYDYATTIYNKNGIIISKVQQYPFTNIYSDDYTENYYVNNIRAQEGFMFLIKQGLEFDYIVMDNIGYGLAAQSCSKISGIPLIYLRYTADVINTDLSKVDEWLTNRSDYIISSEQICKINNANSESKMLESILSVFKDFISSTNVKDK